jgi:phosphoribosyl 1,2-cyclic phosphodiesterase
MSHKDLRSKVSQILELAADHDLKDGQARERFMDDVLPFTLRGTWGGNTSCVQIDGGEELILCDAGTGLRDLGQSIMRTSPGSRHVYHLFVSHLHWDHIQGFPFFTPAYVPGNTIRIYGCHKELEEAFVRQMEPPFFPVPLSSLGAAITFTLLAPGEVYDIGGYRVATLSQEHPGGSFGYSFSRSGKKVVYSTDSEHSDGEDGPSFPAFFRDADLLIFDAQYSFSEAMIQKIGWGHSSNILGVELAVTSGVKHLVMFHTEPAMDDAALMQALQKTREYSRLYAEDYPLEISMAYDGLEIPL